jgi:hypothetical protein
MHTFVPTEDTIQILNYQKKGQCLNTIERFYIHKETSSNNQLNAKQTIFPNIIFCTILKIGTSYLIPIPNSPLLSTLPSPAYRTFFFLQ